MKQIIYFISLIAILPAILFTSCIKENEYKKYLKDGEITYATRADSVIAHSGKERIKLVIILGNDPNVNKVKVFWNNRRDSTEIEVQKNLGKDTVSLIISDLGEGGYNFNVYTIDSQNNSSVEVNVSGESYGNSYISSLGNRRLKGVNYSNDGLKLQLNWENPPTGEVYTELYYNDENGNATSLIVSPEDKISELVDFNASSELRYRSFFKPDSNSFDHFFIEYSQINVPKFERLLDKKGFKDYHLPTDAKDGGYGWLIEYLWDENYNPPGFASESRTPLWFTFDLGVSTTLSRFKIWQANDRLFEKESVKRFEVWGSNDPDLDGSWDSWTKLMDCESIKPSGSPVGQNTSADVEYAKAGEEYIFPSGIPEVRYLRFKLLENWGNSHFMTIGELSFWTSDKQ